MSTAQVTDQLVLLVSKILEELEYSADTSGKISNGDVVSSFQNVVMMDFHIKVDDLPKVLQQLYYRSQINPVERRNYEVLRRSLVHFMNNGA